MPAAYPTELSTDLLIVGSGVAGAYAALTAASLGVEVAIVTKTSLISGSTMWAQGGIAFPIGDDDVALHLADTLTAGRGLSDATISNTILEESLDHLRFLTSLGMKFDPEPALEGGHSIARVLHAGGDQSGLHLLQFLHHHLPGRVKLLEQHFVAELLVDDGEVLGALLWENGIPELPLIMRANATILATGGCGRLYPLTTNPPESTGDGLALASRAGAVLRDIELIQFHPTALSNGALISEACRGAGALLVDSEGVRFMRHYDPMAELAPRDVVARAIHSELARGSSVFLDLRPIADLNTRFPTVFRLIEEYGLDPYTQLVPVSPAAHYLMGGIRTDDHGKTSLPRLYAAGEVASTGLHGANRLASNSLLEGLVMGARCATAAVKELGVNTGRQLHYGLPLGMEIEKLSDIQAILDDAASVVRSGAGLADALGKLHDISYVQASNSSQVEIGNLHHVAELVVKGALAREESRGSHFRLDFPSTDDQPFHIDQRNRKVRRA